MATRNVVLVGVIAAFVLVGVFFYYTLQERRTTRITALKARYEQLNTAQLTSQFHETAFSRLLQRQNDEYAAANAAGQRRRTEYLREEPSKTSMFEDADAESQLVQQMQATQTRRELWDESDLQLYRTVYGESAVTSFRSALAARNESLDDAIQDWSRVILSIRDSYEQQLRGRYGSSDTRDEYERLYSQSNRDFAKAKRYSATTAVEGNRLFEKLASDASAARTALLAEHEPLPKTRARIDLDHYDYLDNNLWKLTAVNLDSGDGTVSASKSDGSDLTCAFYSSAQPETSDALPPPNLTVGERVQLYYSSSELINHCTVWLIAHSLPAQ